MQTKDKLKYILAKLIFKKTVLFSRKSDWAYQIRKELKTYMVFFYDFDEVNLNLFDVVVPLTLHAQRYFNDNPGLLKKQNTFIPSNSSIDLCDDKEIFHVFLINNNFVAYTPDINKNFSYPFVLKKKIGEWGEGVSIISDEICESKYSSEIASKDYFKQEYVAGKKEYTTHVIVIDGEIVFFKTLEFIFSEELFVKGNNFKHTEVNEVEHKHFQQIFKAILLKIDYQGICCFNYKLTDGIPKIFEINPRYGGSMTRFINEALVAYRKS